MKTSSPQSDAALRRLLGEAFAWPHGTVVACVGSTERRVGNAHLVQPWLDAGAVLLPPEEGSGAAHVIVVSLDDLARMPGERVPAGGKAVVIALGDGLPSTDDMQDAVSIDFFVFPGGVGRMVSGRLETLCTEAARARTGELLLLRSGLRTTAGELSSPVCYANEFPGYWDGEAVSGSGEVGGNIGIDGDEPVTKRDRA